MSALLPTVTSEFIHGGLDLKRAYAYKLCAPARASLLSGRWPHRAYELAGGMRACKGLSPGFRDSLAERLRDGAGYRSHHIGKWHLGYISQAYCPWRRGFATSEGYFGSGCDKFSRCSYKAPPEHQWRSNHCRMMSDPPLHPDERPIYDWYVHDLDGRTRYSHPTIINASHGEIAADAHEQDELYVPTLQAKRVQRIILSHDPSTAPLFLYLAFAAVHSPLQATPALLERVDALRGLDYFNSCEWFDWSGTGLPNPTPANPHSPVPTIPTSSAFSTCIPHRRRLLEALALSIDDALLLLINALHTKQMYNQSLLVLASDNGGAINQQGS